MIRDRLFVLLCLFLSFDVITCSRDVRPVSRKILVYSWKNAYFDDSGARCLGVPVAEIVEAEVLNAYDILPKSNEAKPVTGPPDPIPNSPWLVVIDPIATPKVAWLIHVDGKTFWRYDSATGYSNKLVLGAPTVQVTNDVFTKILAIRLAKINRNILKPYELMSSGDPFAIK